MKYFVLPLIVALGACSTNAPRNETGERFGVEFSARVSADTVRIACAPPGLDVPPAWVVECDQIAARYLQGLVEQRTLSDFPDPPFGMAGQAMLDHWDRMRAISAEPPVLRREISLSEPAGR